MNKPLASILKSHKFPGNTEAFKSLVYKSFRGNNTIVPLWPKAIDFASPHDLLLNPIAASEFCAHVRRQCTELYKLPSSVILCTLEEVCSSKLDFEPVPIASR